MADHPEKEKEKDEDRTDLDRGRSRTPAKEINKNQPIGDPKPDPRREVID